MSPNLRYDIIICGMGCAGLSLADRLCSDEFSNKKILLIDKETKTKNDRTWSFWTDSKTRYDQIVYKRWNHINFYGNSDLERQSIHPYQYQMIRGIDFYSHILQKISAQDNIDVAYGDIQIIEQKENLCYIKTEAHEYVSSIVFSSIVREYPEQDHLFVWQHFKGWRIKIDKDIFDRDTATFMDFRIEQKEETRFIYVLPFSKDEALIEATIFSKKISTQNVYDEMLKDYCQNYLCLDKYDIVEEEVGAIPMTTTPINRATSSNLIIPVGTLNDTVKPSSGYAFIRIQEEADLIIDQLRNDQVKKISKKSKYIWYDRTLLDVIISQREEAKNIFSIMFERNKAPDIFNFLNEKSSLRQEIGIFWTLPFLSFLKAFLKVNVFGLTKK